MPVVGEAAMVAPLTTHVNWAIPQLSLVVGLGVVTAAVQEPIAVLTIILLGHVTVGAMASITFTRYEHVVELPLAS